ncbi:MAG: Flp family type IVb pilin [Alphaproteobacteria bacterium]|nr:Flp family type IVb pilin [Alphaproteobacteria bacterium]
MGAAQGHGELSDAAGGHPADSDAARSAVECLARDARGTTAIEYALIAAIISVGLIAAFTTVGSQVKAMFASIVF